MAWAAHGAALMGRLRTVVVLREPVSRLYSAYVHGKQFRMRNQVWAGERGAEWSGATKKVAAFLFVVLSFFVTSTIPLATLLFFLRRFFSSL